MTKPAVRPVSHATHANAFAIPAETRLEDPGSVRTKPPTLIAWHYTTGEKFSRIIADGFLRPSTIGVVAPEKPILWFSVNQTWEPTATKPLGRPDGSIQLLTMEECRDYGGGLCRFGIDSKSLIRWPELGKKAKIAPTLARGLCETAKTQGANPLDWFGTIKKVPVSRIARIDVMDENGAWIVVREACQRATGGKQ